jgi:hypothetical protein
MSKCCQCKFYESGTCEKSVVVEGETYYSCSNGGSDQFQLSVKDTISYEEMHKRFSIIAKLYNTEYEIKWSKWGHKADLRVELPKSWDRIFEYRFNRIPITEKNFKTVMNKMKKELKLADS